MPHSAERQHDDTATPQPGAETRPCLAKCTPGRGVLRVHVAETDEHADGEIFCIFACDAKGEEEQNIEHRTRYQYRLLRVIEIVQSEVAHKQSPGDHYQNTECHRLETIVQRNLSHKQRKPQTNEWQEHVELPLGRQCPERPVQLPEGGLRGVHKEG